MRQTDEARAMPATGDVASGVIAVLEDLKAERVVRLDVAHLTTITDVMIIASGRSDRHVRAIADALLERCKASGFPLLGIEGHKTGEWVLVDLADVVVHIMIPDTREFYEIEKLWDLSGSGDEAGER